MKLLKAFDLLDVGEQYSSFYAEHFLDVSDSNILNKYQHVVDWLNKKICFKKVIVCQAY